ncbi:MAG: FimV/HubP family polar landmark protein [Pseudomonadales bacterium]|nr:FimV/HubP family polar landmark protein [Pseudomonadales bacterium]
MGKNLVVIFTTLVIFATTQAKALGLGEITVDSALNQPLSARIEMLDMAGINPDQITVALASPADFQRFDIERSFFLENIRFAINTSGGNAQILLTTDAVVREPYLSFVLETRWPSGRVLNEYTVLLDPPVFSAQNNAQTAQSPVPPNTVAAVETSIQNSEEPSQNQSTAGNNSSQNSINAPASTAEPAPRFAAAETAASITVAEGDTLWDIALAVRPDNTYSVQQTMVALQRLNEEAFIADNINMLRQGRVLRIPDATQILAITQQQALAEVAQQNRRYSERRNAPIAAQPVSSPPAANRNARATDSGQLSVVTPTEQEQVDQNVANAAEGQTAALQTQIQQLENVLAVNNEEMDRVDLENAELTQRLTLLEEQIDAAKEIIRLRDLELARLQASLQSQPVVPQETPAPQPTVVTMAPEPGFVATLMNTLAANTFVLIGIVGLLVLLLVVFLIRRSRHQALAVTDEEEIEGDYAGPGAQSEMAATIAAGQQQDYDDELEDNLDEEPWDSGANYAEKFAGHQEEDDSEEQEERRYSGSETAEDAIEEAEELVASGQYHEAKSVLRNAIVLEPKNARLRLKLMEVLVLEGDQLGFELQETEFRSFADEEDMALLALLKARLPEEESEQESDNLAEDELDDLDTYLSPEEEAEIELDLNASAKIDDDKVLEQESSSSEAEEDESGEEEDFSFDFDLSDTSDLEAASSATAEEATDEDEGQDADEQEDDFEKIDFDFSIDDDDETVAPAQAETAETESDVTESAPENAEQGAGQDSEFDDLEFTLADNVSEQGADQDEEDEDEDSVDFLSETEEAATKLDLARAYIDMGDNEGAREILAEVLKEGTEAQVHEAQELIDRID